jgi:ribonucleoside-diphosphate reductase alpha chain
MIEEQPIVTDTWRDKYRHGSERDLAATMVRVVDALTKSETPEFRERALAAADRRTIMPGGRILAGAGTDKRVTWINCFVLGDIQDSMRTHADRPGKGIMDSCSDAAYTMQMGGGIGQDFSTVRPRGAVVKRTGSMSSGVIPFMRMWHHMSNTIMSAGHRRGAMMGNLRVDHPDVEEFIEAKQTPGELTNFNVSVLVTDDFMDAVDRDEDWDLVFNVPRADGRHVALYNYTEAGNREVGFRYVYKRLRARELWDKIIGSTYVYAEPGVVFIDRVNKLNNLAYCETIHATNPCGEQPLPANGDCCLGHVNLAEMVINPFEVDALLDWEELDNSAKIMVRLLDNVLDVSPFPLNEQVNEALAKRRIGLGFTGLATALQQLRIPYGSEESINFMGRVAHNLAVAAYEESVELAQEKGVFQELDREEYLRAPFVSKLPEHLRADIAEHGIRNSVLLSVAPTGTTSLVLGNVSSGIEPVFAYRYNRTVRAASGELSREYGVYDCGYLRWCRKNGRDPDAVHAPGDLPDYFVTTDQLTVDQHLRMVAAAQEWVDAGITKTINCPTSMSLEDFKEVYRRAYDLGLKGCTTYRPDPRSGRGAVLTKEEPGPKAREKIVVSETTLRVGEVSRTERQETREEVKDEVDTQNSGDSGAPLATRPDKIPMQEVVEGRRYQIKWPTEDCAYYVVITDYVDGAGRHRPFELFISTKSERHGEWVKAFSLLVTAIFRREGDPTFVVDELRSVFSASGGAWLRVPWDARSKLVPSLVAAIGLKIEEHMRHLGMIGEGEAPLVPPQAAPLMPVAEMLDVCDRCGARAVVYSEGCATCHACGHSDCG